jgi:FMN-dependent NADH-azoreductase
MPLFRLDASIRVEGSHSREIADLVEKPWRDAHPDDTVITRQVGLAPLPSTAWANAVAGSWTPADQRAPEQAEAVALAATLADELIAADALLFALPLYNFGVSQHFKAWVDLIITDPRFAPGGEQVLAGKTAIVVLVRGGGYGPGTPRAGWDHGEGWIRRILEDVWGLNVEVVELELTLAHQVEAMAELRPLADELRSKAENYAAQHGHNLVGASA